MDEQQLQLLWDSHGKNGGFKDFNEFKSLIENNESRKIFFDNTNSQLGFKDYDEFETLLGVKKKESTTPSSQPSAPSSNQSGSEAPSTAPDQNLENYLNGVKNAKLNLQKDMGDSFVRNEESKKPSWVSQYDVVAKKANVVKEVTSDPNYKNLTTTEKKTLLNQKLIENGLTTPEEVANKDNVSIEKQKYIDDQAAKDIGKLTSKFDNYKTVYYDGQNYDNVNVYHFNDLDYAILPDKTKVKYVGDKWVPVNVGEAEQFDKVVSTTQKEYFDVPQNITKNLFSGEDEKKYGFDVNRYLYNLKETDPSAYDEIARTVLGNRGSDFFDSASDKHSVKQNDINIQRVKQSLIYGAQENKIGSKYDDLNVLAKRVGDDKIKGFISLNNQLQDPNVKQETKDGIIKYINDNYSPSEIDDIKKVVDYATEIKDANDTIKTANETVVKDAYNEQVSQQAYQAWADNNKVLGSIADAGKGIIDVGLSAANGIFQLPKKFDQDNSYGLLDLWSDSFNAAINNLTPTTANRQLYGEDGFDASAVLPLVARGITSMALLGKGGNVLSKAGLGYNTGVLVSSFALSHNDYYEMAKGKMSDQEANNFSIAAAGLTSMLELISPGEKIWGDGGIAGITLDEAMKRYAKGETFESIIKPLGKEIVNENIQEVSQDLGDKFISGVANSVIGKDALDTSYNINQFLETIVATTFATGLAGGFRGVQTKGDSREEILNKLSSNDTMLNIALQAIQNNVDTGVITQDKADSISEELTQRNSEFNAMPPDWSDTKKAYIANVKQQLTPYEKSKYTVDENGAVIENDLTGPQKEEVIALNTKINNLADLSNVWFDNEKKTKEERAKELLNNNPAPVQAILETVGKEDTPEVAAQKIEELKTESEKVQEEKDYTVGEMIETPLTLNGQNGSIVQDGQTMVFKITGTNKEIELGNVDEIKDKPISEFNISHQVSVVSPIEHGKIMVRDKEYVNNYSDPLQAINRDDEGNVVSVNLETADGKKRTFKGNVAEDIAYQIHLQEISKDNVQKEDFVNFINQNQDVQSEIDNSGGIPEVTPSDKVENNETVPTTENAQEQQSVPVNNPLNNSNDGQSNQEESRGGEETQKEENVLIPPAQEDEKVGVNETTPTPSLNSKKESKKSITTKNESATNEGTTTPGVEEGPKKIQDNGQDVIGSRGRPESEKNASRIQAKEKIEDSSKNIALQTANKYNESVGLPPITPHEFKLSEKDIQSEIGSIYNELEDVTRKDYKETELEKSIFEGYQKLYPDLLADNNITNYKELVEKSYDKLISEVDEQFKALPVKVEFHEGVYNYESSQEMMDDVHNFNHLWVFKGGDDHTLLGDKTRDENGLTANDKFRAVHDFFGHALVGYQFGKNGEENAWIEHSKMFSPLAQLALSSETRGQNSYVNYSGTNDVPLEKMKLAAALQKQGVFENNQEMIDEGKKLLQEANDEFHFAEQKSLILPPLYTDASQYYSATENNEELPPPPIDETEKVSEETPEGKGITHAATEAIRDEYGFDKYEREATTREKLSAQADDLLRQGYNFDDLLKKLERSETPTPLETVLMGKYLYSLKNAVDQNPSNENIAKLKRFTNASDKAGSDQSVAFNLRKDLSPVENTLADYLLRETVVNKSDKLTDNEKAIVTEEFNNIDKAKTDLENHIKEKVEDNNRKIALKEVRENVARKPKTKKTEEQYAKEREDILQSIKDKWKEAGKGDNMLTSVIIPLPFTKIKQLISVAPDVTKLMKIYIEQGIDKLDTIIDNIHDSLKGQIDGITKNDIRDIIAGAYNEPPKTKRDTYNKLFDLKTEAKLRKLLEDLENGEVPVTEKKQRERNQEITRLREKIKALKRGLTEEEIFPNDKQKIESAKNRIQQQIEKVEEDIREGRFAPEEKAPIIKLDKEGLALKDKLIKLKNERERRLIQKEYANRSTREKIEGFSKELINIPRTLESSVDFSAPFRQGLVATIAHPIVAFGKGGAFWEMFSHGFSQKRFDRWFHDLRESEGFKIMEQSGLYVADPHNVKLSAKEEQFMNNIAEKIPIIGQSLNFKVVGKNVKIPGLGLIKGSERAYVSYLNKLRLDLFKQGIEALEANNPGMTFEKNPEMYKGMASLVNNSTGRGGLGKYLENASPFLNGLLFSPRLIASRLNMLGLGDVFTLGNGFYGKLPPKIRIMAIKDMAKLIGFGLTFLGLMKIGFECPEDCRDCEDCVNVEDDPRSSEFGKIKYKNTRYDIWGGFQQFIHLLAQIPGKRMQPKTGKLEDLDGKHAFGNTPLSVIFNFGRGKLAPIPSTLADYLAKSTVVGEKFEENGKFSLKVFAEKEAENRLTMLLYQDVKEALKDQGIKSLFTVGLPATFGVGVQTYDDTKKPGN